MRIVLSIFLVIIILIGSFKEASIFISFKLQQERIAKTLCVERDIEDSKCGGCCQLKNKLDEQQNEQKAPQPSRKIVVNFDFLFTCIALNTSMYNSLSDLTFPNYKELHYKIEFDNDLFRPPQSL